MSKLMLYNFDKKNKAYEKLEHPVVKYLREKPINLDKLEKLAGVPKTTCLRLVVNNVQRSKHFVTLEEYLRKEMTYQDGN